MVRHHLHFRVTQNEYEFLKSMAIASGESIATVLRSLIRRRMGERAVNKLGTGPVPALLNNVPLHGRLAE